MKWQTLNTTMKVIVVGIFIVALLAGASAIHSWFADKLVTSETFTEAKDMKKAKDITRERVKANVPIEVLKKEEAVKKLKIGDPIKSNPNIQITDTAELPPWEGKTNVLATWDTAEGKIKINAEQVPLSFFGFENKKELGVRVGYSTDGMEMRSTVFGRWQFARIGNVHLGIYGEANSRGEGIGQLEISYKF
jgi:hypothetical protein